MQQLPVQVRLGLKKRLPRDPLLVTVRPLAAAGSSKARGIVEPLLPLHPAQLLVNRACVGKDELQPDQPF